MAQAMRAILLASAMAATFVGRLAKQRCEPRPVLGAMDLGIADDRQCAGREQAAQIAIALFADTAEPVLAPLECCFGTSPIQAEKSRPDRKAFGSATLATRAVASAGPTPGISSSRLLVSLDRCQALIIRSNSRICALSTRSWCAERGETRARNLGHPFVTWIGDDPRAVPRHHCVRPARRSRTLQDGRGSH